MLNRIETLFAQAKDLTTHRISNDTSIIEVAYISTLCDESKVSDYILVPFMKQAQPYGQILKLNPSFKSAGGSG